MPFPFGIAAFHITPKTVDNTVVRHTAHHNGKHPANCRAYRGPFFPNRVIVVMLGFTFSLSLSLPSNNVHASIIEDAEFYLIYPGKNVEVNVKGNWKEGAIFFSLPFFSFFLYIGCILNWNKFF